MISLLIGLLLFGAPGLASAQSADPGPSVVPAQSDPALRADTPALHQLSAYATAGFQAYLSDARTIGGLSGGVGIRDTLHDWIVLQADLSYLMLLGNAFSLCLGAGVQRPGVWTPAVLATLTTYFGDQLSFLTALHPTPAYAPAIALGLNAAPLRFSLKGTQVSLLEVGLGIGSDFPGRGISYQVRALEVGASF